MASSLRSRHAPFRLPGAIDRNSAGPARRESAQRRSRTERQMRRENRKQRLANQWALSRDFVEFLSRRLHHSSLFFRARNASTRLRFLGSAQLAVDHRQMRANKRVARRKLFRFLELRRGRVQICIWRGKCAQASDAPLRRWNQQRLPVAPGARLGTIVLLQIGPGQRDQSRHMVRLKSSVPPGTRVQLPSCFLQSVERARSSNLRLRSVARFQPCSVFIRALEILGGLRRIEGGLPASQIRSRCRDGSYRKDNSAQRRQPHRLNQFWIFARDAAPAEAIS